MRRLKQVSKEDQYFTEMLDKEREYRASTGGKGCDTPFVTPLLFQIRSTLGIILRLLSLTLGVILSLLALKLL